MKERKYCKQCGCYIPDDMDTCLACGNIRNEIYIEDTYEDAYRYLESLYNAYRRKATTPE